MAATLVAGSLTDATGTGLSTRTLTLNAVDNLAVLLIRNTSATSTKSVSSIAKTSGTGATGTWVRLGTAGSYSSGGTYWGYELWGAQITTAGSLTVTVTWTPSAPSATVEIVTFEWNSSYASTIWAGVTGTTMKNGSSSAISWAIETSNGVAEQIFTGYCDYAVGGTFTGLTAGFTGYNPYNYTIYNPALAPSTGYAPSVTNSASGTWITAGWIISASSAAIAATGILTGVGSLTGTGVEHLGATATLIGTGTLTGTGVVHVTATGTLTGTGALSGNGVVHLNATGTFTGTGMLAGTGSTFLPAAGILTGTGTLTGSGVVHLSATGALTGTGTLTGTASLIFNATGSLTGTGTLRGTGNIPGPAGQTTVYSNPMSGFPEDSIQKMGVRWAP